MKLFRKETPRAVESFKQRVDAFWHWYAEQSQRIYQLVHQGDSPHELTDLLIPQIDLLGPGFGWVYGPGEDGGHSLTLTPEGVLSHQFLADYWRDCAPKLSGWTFYSSRQRTLDLDGCGLRVGDHDVTANDLWLFATADDEHHCLNIEAWHSLFADLPKDVQHQILFLLLDEALGEHGTASLIGEISIVDGRPAGGVRLTQFRDVALRMFEQNQWTPSVPAQSYALLTLEPFEADFLRSDIYTISSSYPDLVLEYLSQGGAIQDPVAQNGASFVFLDIPLSHFPSGRETEVRGEIEDTICDCLIAEKSGLLIGGSSGSLAMYSDFVLFDGDASIEIVRRGMIDLGLPRGSSLNYFGENSQAFVL